MESVLLDAAGRRRAPATMPGTTRDVRRATRACGTRPTRPASRRSSPSWGVPGTGPDGLRLGGLIVVLWRAGLRISEALAMNESDLDPARGAILVRRGKGGKRREVGMDPWAWDQLQSWLTFRQTLPVGALFCVVYGPTRGRPWSAPRCAPSCAASPPKQECDAESRHTSSATPMRSRWPTKACRSSSSSASSVTPTSASRPSTCKASTTPRSSSTVRARHAPMIPARTTLFASRSGASVRRPRRDRGADGDALAPTLIRCPGCRP